MINTTIGKYRITRKIGEGGMATVYEAVHTKLDKKVAIKVLNPSYSSNPQVQKRFEREARLMASLEHENITRITDFEEQPGQLCIVMELLGGEDLSSKIRREGPLKDSDAMRIFSQVLKALSYAHQHPDIVAHRDIKPSNIFILPDGKVKILDFGIAKIVGEGLDGTRTGLMLGTPLYMSPEQVRTEKNIDHRTDIYSLGVTMYFALTGAPPYDDTTDSLVAIWDKIRFNDFAPINSKFWPMIKKACKKDRNERYQDCNAWLKELQRLNNDSTVAEETIIYGGNSTTVKGLDDTVELHPNKVPGKKQPHRKTARSMLGWIIGGVAGIIIIMAIVVGINGSRKAAIQARAKYLSDSITAAQIADSTNLANRAQVIADSTYAAAEVQVIADSTAKANAVLTITPQPTNNDNTVNVTAGEVRIGNQVWMTKNLNVDRFRNGDPIPQARTAEEWARAGENKQPAWCYYENDPANGAKYGKLYNWYAVNDSRGLAPQGWRVPSDAEWTKLADFLGPDAGTKMKSTGGWAEIGNGTNSSGFSGLPGGGRYFDGTFNYIGKFGFWWSSSERNTHYAWYRSLTYGSGNVSRLNDDKGYGFSVRCLRD